MERKVAETALIFFRIQKYPKASTELNPGESGSLHQRPRSLKNPYVFGFLDEENLPKIPYFEWNTRLQKLRLFPSTFKSIRRHLLS
jgi:hypothetical protein